MNALFTPHLDALKIPLQAIEEATQRAAPLLKEAWSALFEDVLNQVPQIKSITWPQYTPYFNDGSTCEFSVRPPEFANDDNPTFETYRESDPSKKLWVHKYDLRKAEEFTAVQKDILLAFIEVMETSEEALRVAFGDHVVVRYTANKGFKTKEYIHD